MQRVADIHDLAKLLFAAGYKADVPNDGRADWLGFVDERHVHRLYLRNRIDFTWLRSQVQLLPPLGIDEARNVIFDSNGIEICGGTNALPSSSSDRQARVAATAVLVVSLCILFGILGAKWIGVL